jgi:hypothetical protein
VSTPSGPYITRRVCSGHRLSEVVFRFSIRLLGSGLHCLFFPLLARSSSSSGVGVCAPLLVSKGRPQHHCTAKGRKESTDDRYPGFSFSSRGRHSYSTLIRRRHPTHIRLDLYSTRARATRPRPRLCCLFFLFLFLFLFSFSFFWLSFFCSFSGYPRSCLLARHALCLHQRGLLSIVLATIDASTTTFKLPQAPHTKQNPIRKRKRLLALSGCFLTGSDQERPR